MRTEIINGITVLYADRGKIIALGGRPTGKEVWLGINDTRAVTEIDEPEPEEETDVREGA